MGFLHNPAAIKPLVRGLGDPDVFVRRDSAFAFHNLATGGVIDAGMFPTLERIARDDEGIIEGSFIIRDLAARAIKEIERSIPSPPSHGTERPRIS